MTTRSKRMKDSTPPSNLMIPPDEKNRDDDVVRPTSSGGATTTTRRRQHQDHLVRRVFPPLLAAAAAAALAIVFFVVVIGPAGKKSVVPFAEAWVPTSTLSSPTATTTRWCCRQHQQQQRRRWRRQHASQRLLRPFHPSVMATNEPRSPGAATSLFLSSSSRQQPWQQQQQRLERQGGGSAAEKEVEEARAGADGYSVMRQPLSKSAWDPDARPEFDVPSSLNEDGSASALGSSLLSGREEDASWYESARRRSQDGSYYRRAPSARNDKKNADGDGDDEEEGDEQQQQLNLFQRSLDTLDYPRILSALEKECVTPAGRRIVSEAAVVAAGGGGNINNDGTVSAAAITGGNVVARKGVPHNQRRAYQPLNADSPEGARERYKAVQEVAVLLGEDDDDDYHYNDASLNGLDLNDYTYRDGLGRKQALASGPPSLGSSSELDVLLLLKAVDRGRVLEGEDLLELKTMLGTFETIKNWGESLRKVEEFEFVELPAWADCINANATLRDLLNDAFEFDKANNNKPQLNGSTFPAVGRLRARIKSLRAEIVSTLDGLVALPSIQSKLELESGGPLYSEVSGSGRLVIPVNPKYASSVGIVHDASRSGKTVYVEPTEIVGLTNTLRQSESELRTEEAKVWRLLTNEIVTNRIALETSAMAVAQIDLAMARYRLGIQKLGGVIPVVGNVAGDGEEGGGGVISLRNARHPVLLLRHVNNVVGSDVELGSNGNQGLVLTGPNSGGKTVIMKLLGLVAMMSKGGIPVPADGAPAAATTTNGAAIGDDSDGSSSASSYRPRVDFFDPVLADIGDIQSVGGDLSTFSGHMLVCREVLANSGKNALVLMDEVGSGTDPNQGVALAQSLLESLVETGARVAITTHFMQLKQLAASDDRFAVAGMQFINGRPTYKLLPGTVGESFALSVAERLQLPRKVIDRATELLDSETRQMGELIRELEDQKAVLDEQALKLEQKKKEMAQLEMKIKEEKIRLEKKQLTARREEAKKFAKALEEKEAILEDVLDKLKSDPSRRVVAKSWEEIKFMKRDALNEAENVPSVLARKQKHAEAMEEVRAELVPVAELREKPELKEGDKVTVCKKGPLLGREATITKSLGGRVEVRVNNMNIGLKLSEIAIPMKGGRKAFSSSNNEGPSPPRKAISKAAERAIADEQKENHGSGGRRSKFDGSLDSPLTAGSSAATSSPSSSKFVMRTQSNTVDVRGCNLEQAKDMIAAKFSKVLMGGSSSVVYILHGHGSGGVLKSKIRNWLSGMQRKKQQHIVVKNWKPADVSDGGDAFTQVELR